MSRLPERVLPVLNILTKKRTARGSSVALRAAAALCAITVYSTQAGADPVRFHAALDIGKALGGFQDRELSFGAAAFVSAELPLIPQLGAEGQLSTLLLAAGDPPLDPGIKPEGGAYAVTAAVGVITHPFAKPYASPSKLVGIWASGHVGGAVTGSLLRPTLDMQVGYDFHVGDRYGIGPTLGLLHVFQPDSELRPDDANVLLFGVHGTLDTAPPPARPDRDHDGFFDDVDGCPDDPEDRDGFKDDDGCPDPDNDADGVLDSVDHCPDIPEDRDGFEDRDGCPDPDNDNDGLVDPKDKCPNQAEDVDGFEDTDGCPDLDNDADGFPDKEDLCPNEPETKNGYADEDGCPDEDQVRVVGQRIVLDDRVHFEQNNARIREISFPLLERLSKLLRDHPEYVHIEVQGHTDQRGTKEFNQKLSLDRATSVLEFLVKQGVDRGRLNAVGFGAEHLLVDKENERALFLNRRVEFQITRQPAPGVGASPAPADAAPVAPPAPAPSATPPAPGPAGAAPEPSQTEKDGGTGSAPPKGP